MIRISQNYMVIPGGYSTPFKATITYLRCQQHFKKIK